MLLEQRGEENPLKPVELPSDLVEGPAPDLGTGCTPFSTSEMVLVWLLVDWEHPLDC